MCIGINFLVGGRARAESNPGHWACHALLHMAAEYVNHSAMEAGLNIKIFLYYFLELFKTYIFFKYNFCSKLLL